MNKRMKIEPYSHTAKCLSLCVLSNMLTAFYFLKSLLNDIFHVTDTDIFASFIREMIYKRRILCHPTYQKKGFMLLRKIVVVVSLH